MMYRRHVRYPVASFCLLAFLLPSCCVCSEPDALIGWGGDRFNHGETFAQSLGSRRWVETLSWHPRAFLFHGFVSEEEADQLIIEAAPRMKRSTVVGDTPGVVDSIRTSYGSFLGRLSSPAIEVLEKQLANWTQLPIVHQEDVQVSDSCLSSAIELVYNTVSVRVVFRYFDMRMGKSMGLTTILWVECAPFSFSYLLLKRAERQHSQRHQNKTGLIQHKQRGQQDSPSVLKGT